MGQAPCSAAAQDDASERPVSLQLKAQQIICNADAPLPCSQECVDNVAKLLSGGAAVDDVVFAGPRDHRFVGHQEHLLAFAGELPRKERSEFKAKVRAVDCTMLRDALVTGVEACEHPIDQMRLAPPNELIWGTTRPKALARGAHVIRQCGMPRFRQKVLYVHGLDLLASSTVAVVLLAGAMDRRLGQGRPAGMADIGLLSGKCMFQVYAQRVLRLRHLVQRYITEKVWEINELRDKDKDKDPSYMMGLARRPARRSSTKQDIEMLKDAGILGGELEDWDPLRSGDTLSVSFDTQNSEGGESSSAFLSFSVSEGSSAKPEAAQPDAEEDGPIGLHKAERLRKRISGKLRSAYHVLQNSGVRIPFAVMCNEHNRLEIEDFWRENDFFGLPAEDVLFFNQGTMPAVDSVSGRIFLQSKHQMAIHPNGGGGVFQALRDEGIAAQFKASGVEHVFIASQDNLLMRVADPLFMGICALMKVKAGVKCVAKGDASEGMGIFCNRRPPEHEFVPTSNFDTIERHSVPVVLEPVETSADVKACMDAHGNIVFDAASICQFYFTLGMVNYVADKMPVTWHVLHRRQPHINLKTGASVSPPPDALNSYRLEMFLQDAFEVTRSALGLIVPAAEEWAPVKHLKGASSPATAVLQMGQLHFNWVCDAGAHFANGACVDVGRNRCEVSPLVSYAGEDFDGAFGTRGEMSLPLYIQSGMEQNTNKAMPGASVFVARASDWTSGGMRRKSSIWALPLSSFVEAVEESRLQQDLQSRPSNGAICAKCNISMEFMEATSESELPSTPEEMRIARSTMDDRIRLAEQEAIRMMAEREGNLFSESDFDAWDQLTDGTGSERTDSPRSGVSSLPVYKLPRIAQRSNVTSRIPNGQRKLVFSVRRRRPNLTGLESGYKPPPEDADVASLNLNLKARARCNRKNRTSKHSMKPKLMRKFVTHNKDGFRLERPPPDSHIRYQWTLGRAIVPAEGMASVNFASRSSQARSSQMPGRASFSGDW